MVEIRLWTERFLEVLDRTFGERVWFVGLQGSYGRGEATESSDIDWVVILDEVSPSDIRAYDRILDTLPHRELACGFLSGKNELLHWEASDLFQFCHDTLPLRGSLDEALRLVTPSDVERAVKIGVCNLYHGCVHNLLYEKSDAVLYELYKSASFVVQAVYFRQTGTYVKRQSDLLRLAGKKERAVVETFLHLKNRGAVDFDVMSERLFTWAKNLIEGETEGNK